MMESKRTTILDATVTVLRSANAPRSAAEIHESIAKQKLFEFKAKDPVGIVRSAIRKHLRTHAGTPNARVRVVDKDRYALP
ncbi:MAG TPA: hypothetical protein PK156_17725 [Polyangium sp.]|nr:hypothetical protein [Polyangium sp.]